MLNLIFSKRTTYWHIGSIKMQWAKTQYSFVVGDFITTILEVYHYKLLEQSRTLQLEMYTGLDIKVMKLFKLR